MSVYIIQVLCPNRHAIVAITYDQKDIAHDVALAGFQQQVEHLIETKTINPWCALCKSRVWTYEQRRTKYQTMEEALPELKALELEQMLTRAQIETVWKADKN